MTSEIRVNKLTNRVGLGTVEYTNTGIVVSGISTSDNFKTGTSNLHSTGLNVQDLDVDGHTNLDNVSIAGVTTASGNINMGGGNLIFGDSGGDSDDKLVFGAGSDFKIFHNGSNNYIDVAGNGHLYIRPKANFYIQDYTNGEVWIDGVLNGGVQLYNNGLKKFETDGNGITVQGNINMALDNGTLYIGAGNDLRLFHNGTTNFIRSTGATIQIDNSSGVPNAQFVPGQGTKLYYGPALKFTTETSGVNITGIATATTVKSSFGGIVNELGYISGGAEGYTGTASNHSLFIGTAGSNRIKIANNSAATSIGGSMVFNAMLTVQGDLSGAIFQLKAAENTTRMMVSGLDTSDCEVNLYDKNGGQRGILVGGETEFALKAPNSSAPMTFYTHNGSSVGERLRITSGGALQIGNLQTSGNTTHSSETKLYIDSTRHYKIARRSTSYINTNGAGWYNAARIGAFGAAYKCFISLGGDFKSDVVSIDIPATSYNNALNNTLAGPIMRVTKTGAHNYNRITKVRIAKDSSNLIYIQFYLATGYNANSWGKSTLETEMGTYAQGSADSVNYPMFEKISGTYTNIKELDTDVRDTIVHSGTISKPDNFYLVAKRSGNLTGYNASNTGDPVIWNSFQSGSPSASTYLNTSTGLFTAPYTGLYHFHCAVNCNYDVQGSWLIINGSRAYYSATNPISAQTADQALIFKVTKGDTVGVKWYRNGSTNATINDNSHHTWWRITLL